MSDNPLITKLAERFTIDEQHLLTTLTATAFRQRNDTPPSHEQLMALLLVADQYGLRGLFALNYTLLFDFNGF